MHAGTRWNQGHHQFHPYIQLENGYEIGIVNTSICPEIACIVSGILSRSVDDAKDINGGYVPHRIVTFAQKHYVSPYAVTNLWGKNGNRFILSKRIDDISSEIIATVLISSSKDNLFFFTNRYHNLRPSTINQDIDWNQTMSNDINHRWFDKFDFPPIEKYKPSLYNQMANFAVDKKHRGGNLGDYLLKNIIKYYSLTSMLKTSNYLNINHSQSLICGIGLYQIADPSWYKKMSKIGFNLRLGCESFYIDKDYDKLSPNVIYTNSINSINSTQKIISNVEYNALFDMPAMYQKDIDTTRLKNPQIHLLERIPLVIELSTNPKAKLQYFQLYLDF